MGTQIIMMVMMIYDLISADLNYHNDLRSCIKVQPAYRKSPVFCL